MIHTGDVYKCCGCSACASICGHDAIIMRADPMGFLYPKVEVSKCVNCGLCEQVCSFQGVLRLNMAPKKAYAVRHIDINEVETSRSGAAFIALSDYILEHEGIVYGAGYGAHFSVRHKRADSKIGRNEFKGSKYAQSNLMGIYDSIKEDLKSGKTVLFSGTPCQTAAIREYIPVKMRTNLFLIDIICHGVSSPAIWDDYLLYLERKVGQSLKSVDFRDKLKYGWSGMHKESFVFEDGVKRTFQYTYYNDLLIRPSCSVCPDANLNSPSDITIGDLLGWEKSCPTMNEDDKGCSLVLINSDNGERLFELSRHDMVFFEVALEKCMQPNLQRPTTENILRAQFELDYITSGFKYVMHKYGEVGLKYHYFRVVRFVKRQINKFFR